MWCFGVLVRPNFGLGGKGESATHIFGTVTLSRKHRNQKQLQHNSYAQVVFAFSVILPIHGIVDFESF